MPGLRISSSNPCGIARFGVRPGHKEYLHKATALAREWHQQRLDIILLQEHKLSSTDSVAARFGVEFALGFFGYRVLAWGCNATASAGVAIVAKAHLVASGALTCEPPEPTPPSLEGRLLGMRIKWGGLPIFLQDCYAPCAGHSVEERTTFLQQAAAQYAPWAASHRLISGGDFNFAPAPADRWPVREPGSQGSDVRPRETMAKIAQDFDLLEIFRTRHPLKRAYTYYSATAASRLDHFYVSSSLDRSILSISVQPTTVAPDHRPLVLHLLASSEPPARKRLRRARMNFWEDEYMRLDFQTWLAEQVEAAPTDDAALLAWWPASKAALLDKLLELDQQYRQHTAARSQQERTTREAAMAANTALETAEVPDLPAAVAAAAAYRAAAHAAAAAAASARAVPCLLTGERPGPALTQMLRPPKASTVIHSIRTPSGGLTQKGPEIAAALAHSFAAVSTAPPADPAAEEEVLEAFRLHATRIPEAQAALAGCRSFTLAEVKAAAAAMAGGRSPGPDGLPPELWRRGGETLLGLLRRVLNAIGSTGSMPQTFLDGVITPIYKGTGDGTLPSNYRPITLLDTDYRLLAKALATRLGPVLGAAIGPEQSAYLPKRRIGASLQLLLTLPHLLRENELAQNPALPTRAAVAFLDFRKAYDTVSRPFLLRIMQEAGAGEGLCFWASTLLSSTQAAACANGHVSEPLPYHAGVRQGCPLAPLLYLFVAWALSAWLQSHPALGIDLSPGRRHTGIQYADDIQVLLRDWEPATVQTLLDAMSIFARASGQRLNTSKTRLLLLGAKDAALPEEVQGLQCASHAEALGCTIQDVGTELPSSRAAWTTLISRIEACFERLSSRVPFSIFGRSHAAATYGVSTLLHRAEFLPVPEDAASRLQVITKTLVDKGSTNPRARPPGVHSRLLVGKRALGGFGYLPFAQHCAARHAVWGRLFFESSLAPAAQSPAWAVALGAQLSARWPHAHPALLLLDLACSAGPNLPTDDPSGGPLLLITLGLRKLGPLTHVHTMAPGDWCAHLPVWCNPYLNLEVLTHPAVVDSLKALPCLERPWSANAGYRPLRAMRDALNNRYPPPCLPGVHTLGDLVRLHAAAVADPSLPEAALYGPGTSISLDPATRVAAASWILAVQARLPAEWWHAAREQVMEVPGPLLPRPSAAVLASAETTDAVRRMLRGAGWIHQPLPHPPPSAGPALRTPLAWQKAALTVRVGTSLQLAEPLAEQRIRRMQLVRDALTAAPTPAPPGQPSADSLFNSLYGGMRYVARYEWLPNRYLDTFWRLGVNGVPYAGGYDQPPSRRAGQPPGCKCGWAGPPPGTASEPASRVWRSHVFGSCPVARAVTATICSCLPAEPGAPQPGTLPSPEVHLWLMSRPPVPSLHDGPWRVVCLAAIAAMDFGRQALHRLSAAPPVAPPPALPAALPLPPAVSPVRGAELRAVARFWDILLDITASCPAPPSDWAGVGASHPILCVVDDVIRCVPPAGLVQQ